MKYCNACGKEIKKWQRTCSNCKADVTDYEKYANDGMFWGLVSIFIFIFLRGISFFTSIWGLAKSSVAIKNPTYKSKAQIGFFLSIILIIINLVVLVMNIVNAQ